MWTQDASSQWHQTVDRDHSFVRQIDMAIMRRPFIMRRSNLNSVCCSFSYLPVPKIEIYREHASTVSTGPFSHHVTNSTIRPAPLNGCAPSAHLPIVGLQDPLVSTTERFISTGWRRPMPLFVTWVRVYHPQWMPSKTANSQKIKINCVWGQFWYD